MGPPNSAKSRRSEITTKDLFRFTKTGKLEELAGAGVLRPFGEEAGSSRETTIWLT